MEIFVGASSNENIPQKYVEDCQDMLSEVLKDNNLVFGAYDKGLMGVAYRLAKENKKLVTGICPNVYKESLRSLNCDKALITNSITDSTMSIYKTSDAMIFLPGGFGSIYEFFTAIYCKICKEIDIPVILYNSCGFYDKLISFMQDIINENLVRESEQGKFYIANNKEEVLAYLKDNNKKRLRKP